jgi:hypothetical protein
LGGDLSSSENLVIDRTASVRGKFKLSSTFSTRSFVHLGSALSAEKDARLASQLSALGFTCLGRSLVLDDLEAASRSSVGYD